MIPHFKNFRKIEKIAPMMSMTAAIHRMFWSTFLLGFDPQS